MREKIASYNLVADKGLDLISKIAVMNDLLRNLLLSVDQETVDQIIAQAKGLEVSVAAYKQSLASAVEEITSEDEDDIQDVDGVQDGNGIRLN